MQQAEEREREDYGGESDADANSGFAPDVERGGGENAAEKKAGEGGAKRELGNIAAIDVFEPPAILLRTSPTPNLFLRQLG